MNQRDAIVRRKALEIARDRTLFPDEHDRDAVYKWARPRLGILAAKCNPRQLAMFAKHNATTLTGLLLAEEARVG